VSGPTEWVIRDQRLSLGEPLVVGILNVTPDSFSDGGLYGEPGAALRRAVEMVREGAGMIDVGGESTRPGSDDVAEDEEEARVIPVIRRLKETLDVPVSVDTRKARVARAALEAGADVVNDVSALQDPEMGSVVAESGAGLVLMHMRGTPKTMQADPRYDDVVGEVTDELNGALDAAIAAGIDPERVVVDPGIGFAKSHCHNLELLGGLAGLGRLGRPMMLGVSRKAFLGQLLGGAPPEERAVATAAACVAGLLAGARIFRVHDVRPVREALRVAEAIRCATVGAA
jgi:dihydropteroate synthase